MIYFKRTALLRQKHVADSYLFKANLKTNENTVGMAIEQYDLGRFLIIKSNTSENELFCQEMIGMVVSYYFCSSWRCFSLLTHAYMCIEPW